MKLHVPYPLGGARTRADAARWAWTLLTYRDGGFSRRDFMVNVTKLYCGERKPTDSLRDTSTTAARRPVVVWNITRQADPAKTSRGELTISEALAVIDDLASFGVPELVFAGGEPLARPDIFKLIARATAKGLRLTLCTDGALITRSIAARLKKIGVACVGIPLNGAGNGTAAAQAVRHCRAVRQNVCLRVALTKHNCAHLHDIFDFIEEEKIRQASFYHLVSIGCGKNARQPTLAEARRAINVILDRTVEFAMRGQVREILTFDQPADKPYVYLRLHDRDRKRAATSYKWMKDDHSASASGVGIAAIDSRGNVHPDPFWRSATLGNVRQRPFSQIWTDNSIALLAQLRNRRPLLKSRCVPCKFNDVCGGSVPARALKAHGDPFAPDPACYLTDEEIGVATPCQARRRTQRNLS